MPDLHWGKGDVLKFRIFCVMPVILMFPRIQPLLPLARPYPRKHFELLITLGVIQTGIKL